MLIHRDPKTLQQPKEAYAVIGIVEVAPPGHHHSLTNESVPQVFYCIVKTQGVVFQEGERVKYMDANLSLPLVESQHFSPLNRAL